MVSNWLPVKLGDYVKHQKGFAFKSKDYVITGHPVVRVSNFTDRSINSNDLKYLSTVQSKDFDNYEIRTGDVVIATVGSWPTNPASVVGKAIQVPSQIDRALLNQNAVRLRAVEPLNQRFLFNLLKTSDYQNYIVSTAQGSANQASITLNAIFNFEFFLPPLEEQKAIAFILGSLDDKIELNRKMNETLEAMAQALFKSWFVDFDPVIDNALAAGNPIPKPLQARAAARQALGDKRKPLPPEIQNQFPSSFTFDDDIGWIPEGWGAGSMTILADLNPESWTAQKHPDFVNYVDLSNVKNGRISEVVTYNFEDAPSRAKRVLAKDDSIVGTVRPGNRSFAFIQKNGLTGSTGFAVMRPKKKHYRSFVYLALTRNEVINKFAHLADGAAYPAIRPEVVGNLTIVIPDDTIMNAFDKSAYKCLSAIGLREQLDNSLAKTRDTLLPKLLSGQIRIPEAMQQVSEVL